MIEKELWGKINSHDVHIFHLKNDNGLSVGVANYGSTIVYINCPDRSNEIVDIVLGFDNLENYLGDHPYFGSTVGRYANRIARGTFTIDGTKYRLPLNNGPNCLHGGINGFDKKVWDFYVSGNKLITKLTSPHGSEGFPGNLEVSVSYEIDDANRLIIKYEAKTDVKTHINLTDHTYFNLSGGKRDILDHQLLIDSDLITPINQDFIPLNYFMEVENTPFDFRQRSIIGDKIKSDPAQLNLTGGFDHNYVLKNNGQLRPVAELYHPDTGRKLIVLTDEPGLQLYTGNSLGNIKGKKGKVYKDHYGICLETQHFPDSPNRPDFPSTLLLPEESFHSQTIYQFIW